MDILRHFIKPRKDLWGRNGYDESGHYTPPPKCERKYKDGQCTGLGTFKYIPTPKESQTSRTIAPAIRRNKPITPPTQYLCDTCARDTPEARLVRGEPPEYKEKLLTRKEIRKEFGGHPDDY